MRKQTRLVKSVQQCVVMSAAWLYMQVQNKPKAANSKFFFEQLNHAWATYGPRVKSGPPRLLIRPANKFSRAVGLCNISIFIYFI